MGLLSSHLESVARSKEAKGQTATLERYQANLLAEQSANERQYQQAGAQRRELQRHREMLKADQDAFLEKMDRIQNPEKYVEIDRLREEAADQELRDEATQEVAQELQKAEWNDDDRYNYLFHNDLLLCLTMGGEEHLALQRDIAARPGNEGLEGGSIELMQKTMDTVLKITSPRPLTASYMRDLMGVELAPQNVARTKEKKRGIVWKLTKYLVVIPVICIAVVLALVALVS